MLRAPLPLAAALLALALLAGCDETPAPPSWPEGTAVVLGGAPIPVSEVDRHLEAMGALDPAYTLPHRRRLSLTMVQMPLVHGRNAAGTEGLAAARAEAEAWFGQHESGELAGPPGPTTVGTWQDHGLDVWLVARDLAEGTSSGVVELPGRFAVIELVARDRNEYEGRERFELRIESFWHGADAETLSADLLKSELEIVHPDFEPVVPGFWKHHMRGES